MSTENYQEIIDLANAHIEGRLDDQQSRRLESILEQDPEARSVYVDFLHDHATLHWNEVGESSGQIIKMPKAPRGRLLQFPATWLGIAAAIAISLSAYLLLNPNHEESTSFAFMEKTHAARWASGDLPTSDGARLSHGRLRLVEGLATLRFDSGAKVILEAPAEIELVDAMNCILIHGTTVADIPDTAIGFRIETPSANVVDYGTRFAVNVDPATGATNTQVFEGLVEVEHPGSGELVKLKTGERNFTAGDRVGEASAAPDEGVWAHPFRPAKYGPGWTIIPSQRDTYVHAHKITGHVSDVLLLVKNSDDVKGPSRKTYLGFDLSSIDPEKIIEAKLFLHFAPTGWGLASNVPDAEFTVYGVSDSALDDWNETSMTWKNAPANVIEDGAALLPDKVAKLGTFVIEQGVQRGRFGIRGDNLKEFLQTNKNDGFATLIVVRDTLETDGGGLVHGIASHRHPILPAPTLAIRLQD